MDSVHAPVRALSVIIDKGPPCYKRGLMWALVRRATSHIGVVHLDVNHLAQLNEDGPSSCLSQNISDHHIACKVTAHEA